MSDPLDDWFRAELARTMLPCRELPLTERVAKRIDDEVRQAHATCPDETREAS